MEQTQVTDLFNTPIPREFFSLIVCLSAAYGTGSLLKTRYPAVKFASGIAILSFIAWSIPSLSGKMIFLTLALLLALSSLAGIYFVVKDFSGNRLFFIAAAILFIFFLGSGLLFPYSWDECVYQTALLKHYVSAQNHTVLPDNPFSCFPSLPHSFMRMGIEITGGGIRLPRMLSAAVMAIALGSAIQYSKKCGGKISILFTISAILSPIVLVLSRANYVEQYILLFAIAGIFAIEENRKNAVRCAIMMAIFAGAAVSVKLTGAGICIVLGILYLSLYKSRKFLAGIIAGICVFVVFCLPFFLRTYLAVGNPFFPFCDSLFSDIPARIIVSEHHHLLGSYRYGTGFVSGILYGWLFTALDAKIYDGISSGWQFPAMVIANILLAFYLFKSRSIRWKTATLLLFCSAALYIFWAGTSQQSRFLLPSLIFNAIICSFMCKGISKKNAFVLTLSVLLVSLIPFPANHLKHFITAWKIAPEINSDPKRFLASATRDPGYFEAVDFLKSTPADSKILLLLNERRTLYMPRKTVIGEPYFQERNTPVPENTQLLWQNIKMYDYILVSSANKNPDAQESTANELVKLAELVSELKNEGKIQLVFSDKSGEYFIFRCGETATGAAP